MADDAGSVHGTDASEEMPSSKGTTTTTANKLVIQMNKLREANNKYKSLLKMAKDRISTQQEEMESLKGTIVYAAWKCPINSVFFDGSFQKRFILETTIKPWI